MPKTVEDLLSDIRLLGEDQFQIVCAVQEVLQKKVVAVSEQVKYGGIMFSESVAFAGVFAYKDHVSVEFGHGARIHDEYGHLEGTGKGRRHIKLRTLAEVSSKRLDEYVPLALAAAKSAA